MPVALAKVACLAAVLGVSGLPWDQMPPSTFKLVQNGTCGNGESSYIALITPEELTEPDKIFIEIMGGAICFSKESCLNKDLGVRNMGIEAAMIETMSVPGEMVAMITSGAAIPLAMLQQVNPGFLPYAGEEHPMTGRRGLFMIACTGDINLGRREVTYEAVAYPVDRTCNETVVGNGVNYTGCQNRTRTGIPCQNWSEQTPQTHSHGDVGNHNYCRNPPSGSESQPWCYVTTGHLRDRWDYCEPVGEATDGPLLAHHIGGANMHHVLQAVSLDLPNLTDIGIYGGSGGGVSAVAWAPAIAEMFENVQVNVLADSALHIFPGTTLFQSFYDRSPWGPGPAGQGVGLDQAAVVPDFDWRAVDAIAAHVASFDGRVSVAYFGCIDDRVVFEDRLLMAYYAGLPNPVDELIDQQAQHAETWRFLSYMHMCSPPGTVFSYIQNCSSHAQIRGQNWATPVPGSVSPRDFVFNVLLGDAPDPNHTDQTQFWYNDEADASADISQCSSPVRRRRGVVDPVSSSDGDSGSETSSNDDVPSANEDISSTNHLAAMPVLAAFALLAAGRTL